MWERVCQEENSCATYRMKVPGGWLVRVRYSGYNCGGITVNFVPDPTYEWKLV